MLQSCEIAESEDLKEIRHALSEKLYVPNTVLKPRIIEELLAFFKRALQSDQYDMKFHIAYRGNQVSGFVSSMADKNYTSYSRKCGTFGWLTSYEFDTCKALIAACESHMRSHKLRKARGALNYPKILGGLGFQDMGFNKEMMYGVAFDDPHSKKIEFLEKLGYIKESEYACMHVTQRLWSKGKELDPSIRVGHIPLEELEAYEDDLLEMGKNSFYSVLPDAFGEGRLFELINLYRKVPKSFYAIKEGFDPHTQTDIPYIQEAWNSYDLENMNTWTHLAFDKATDTIVGAIFCLPDLYEHWLGLPITRSNVDTAIVHKDYAGKGIFSALNNLGRLTLEMNGITYFEGTTIWYNNQDAVNSIFPHCVHIRRHNVVQKRIKK